MKPAVIGATVMGRGDLGKLWRSMGLRTQVGTAFISDSRERYWRVTVRVSRRKGRYLKFRLQGMRPVKAAFGGSSTHDFYATADGYHCSHRVYYTVTPEEWANFANLVADAEGRVPLKNDDVLVKQARVTLDRLVDLHLLKNRLPPSSLAFSEH